MIKPPETTDDESESPRKINIVLNWFEELEPIRKTQMFLAISTNISMVRIV